MAALFIMLFFCLLLCSNGYSLPVKEKKKILITVLDLKTGKPIEKAIVFLSFIKTNAVDVVNYKAATNDKGQCSIVYEVCDNLGYTVRTTKNGFYQCYSTDANSNKVSVRNYITNTDKEIILYLTSDARHLINYYSSITPHYQIDTLIRLLRSNTYGSINRGCLPALEWTDIPKLIELCNEGTRITSFAVNPFSSFWQKDCLLGIYSLWLIESIRISEGKPMISPGERFPSLNPILRKKTGPIKQGSEIIDDLAAMKIAPGAYVDWWNKVKNMNPEEACKINPLENTILSW